MGLFLVAAGEIVNGSQIKDDKGFLVMIYLAKAEDFGAAARCHSKNIYGEDTVVEAVPSKKN